MYARRIIVFFISESAALMAGGLVKSIVAGRYDEQR